MLSLKTKATNKKFYGKWLYKVTLHLEGCALLRTDSIDKIKEFCTGPEPQERMYHHRQKAWTNREDLYELCTFIEQYDKDTYNTRIESGCIDFYSNDKDFYDHISLKFEQHIKHRFEPNETTVDLLNENQNYITVKKLPKNKFRYRVYLLPHKMKSDKEAKQKYLDWLKTQVPRVTCTPAVEKWFLYTDWNWDRRYVLVEDEQTLLMLKLRNAEVVGRIYNFVISDK